MLEVRLLGGLSAAVDGRPVELPADARARELLARLALTPGPHPRSVLAGRLRPDVPEESARKTLRSALYELRKALGPDGAVAIVAHGQRIGLDPDAVRVDVWEFRRRLAGGALEAAADAGQGALLQGFDGDWAQPARDEHAAEFAGVLATLTARAEAAGDVEAAVAWARRRLDVEPLGETAQRELIRLLALAGDRPAALAAAGAMRERLRVELGVPPSSQTRALVEDVRRGRLAGDAAVAGPPPLPAVLAGTEPPAGREAALARLEDAWSEAGAGRRRFALVAGEPGIGKTTVAGELARRAHAQGAAVLLGRCDEHALVPFQPWIEALEQLLHALPAADADHWLGEHGGALARLLPARGTALPRPDGSSPAFGPAPSGDPRERYLAFELARALLDDAAARHPVLLVLDDVHWADADSLSLLRHLARSTPRAQMLVVLCARPAELEPAAAQTLADLRREGPLAHVDLSGLDEDAVEALLARSTGACDRDTARRWRARSGGNPLFLEALVREAQEGGDMEHPPAGVRDIVIRRLARLEQPTRRTLDVAAVAGLTFDAATLARADGVPVAAVLEALDGAIQADLVADADGRGRYAFTHTLAAETIASELPASRRAQLHLRLADVAAERHALGETGAGEVALHLRGAGALADAEDLAAWELAAAREASAGLAHAEAAAHYQAALAARPGVPDGEVLLAMGDARDRAGHRGPARAAFAEAARLARAGGDWDLLARAALGHGGMAVVVAAADGTAVDLLEEALASVPARHPATSARLLARLSVELYYADPARARELSARAVEIAQRAEEPAALAAALNARRVALWSPHHAEERLAAADAMIAAAETAGERETLLQGRNWRVVDLLELGRVDEAAAEIDAYAALADVVALPHFGWYVPLWRATLALLAGRWGDARELDDQALALARQADDPNGPLFVGIQREVGLFARRRVAETDRQRLVDGAAASPAAPQWLAWLALRDAETGAVAEARRLVGRLARDGGSALKPDANWHGACIAADAAVLVGDRDAAAALYPLLEPHARLFPLVARAVICLGSCEYFVGRLAGLLGRHDEAEARLRRSIAADDQAGAAAPAALAQLRLGETLADRGRHDAARDALREAVHRADALAMPALAAEAGRRLDAIA